MIPGLAIALSMALSGIPATGLAAWAPFALTAAVHGLPTITASHPRDRSTTEPAIPSFGISGDAPSDELSEERMGRPIETGVREAPGPSQDPGASGAPTLSN